MGVVYYANYFVWFEIARTNFLRDAGWTYREMEQSGFLLPVIDARCEYREPARYDDEVDIQTTGEMMSLVRVMFHYNIVRASDRMRLADGHTVHASINRAGRPSRLPGRAREMFTIVGATNA